MTSEKGLKEREVVAEQCIDSWIRQSQEAPWVTALSSTRQYTTTISRQVPALMWTRGGECDVVLPPQKCQICKSSGYTGRRRQMHHDSTRCVNHPTWHAMTPGGLVSGLFAPSCKWKSGKFMAVSRTVSMADKWMEGANSAKKGNDAFFFSLLWSKNGRVTCLKALLYRSQEYVWAFPYMQPRIAFRCKISEITLTLNYVSLIFVLFPTQTIKACAQPGDRMFY